MAHDLSGYEEVPDRIVRFLEKYPDGSLRGEHQLITVEGKAFVEYIAYAYRSPDDPRPGRGVTWEPFPGTTNFTRDSEVENAETSAWGRALAAIGFVGKKVASANEVRNAQANDQATYGPPLRSGPTRSGGSPSDPQKKFIEKLIKEKKATVPELQEILKRIGAGALEVKSGWMDQLTAGKEGTASRLIEFLKEQPLPSLEHPSDLDNSGFEPSGNPETLEDILNEGVPAGMQEEK